MELCLTVEPVDEPFICSRDDPFDSMSPIHPRPFIAAEVETEPQLMESWDVVVTGSLLLTAAIDV